MTAAEIIGSAKDLLLAGAAVTTAVAAALGVSRWSEELRGKADFDAARGLMRAVYKVREQLAVCRSPLYTSGEYPSGYPTTESSQLEQAHEEARAWGHIYQNRWKPVVDALQELDVQTLEAEALWGQDIRVLAERLRTCCFTIRVAMEAIIEDKAHQGRDFENDKEFGNQTRRQVSASVHRRRERDQ